LTHTTVSAGHRALACASVENWPAAVGAAVVGDRVVAGGGALVGAAAVEGCLAGAGVVGGVAGAVAVDGLAGAAAGGGVAGDGAAVVVKEAPGGCVRHPAMNSFLVFLLA
jgi:hypothetical protein